MKHFINSKIQSIITGIENLTKLENNIWVNSKQGDLVYIESLNEIFNPLYGKEMNEFFLFSRPSLEINTTSSHYKYPQFFRNITLGKKIWLRYYIIRGLGL